MFNWLHHLLTRFDEHSFWLGFFCFPSCMATGWVIADTVIFALEAYADS